MGKKLKVFQDDDPILRLVCRDIEKIETWVLDLADDMMITMILSNAVGLAANQVGFDYRMVALRGPEFQGVMINPIIEHKSKEVFHLAEGCLSIPGFNIDTGQRSREITVSYTDLKGERKTLLTRDLTSVIIQHEVDHLDGKLFTDYLNREAFRDTRAGSRKN